MARNRIKIGIIGDYNSGKTTLVHLLDSRAQSIEAPTDEGTTTVAIDFGRIGLDGLDIYLFGTPGQERFSITKAMAIRDSDGIIIVVDSTAGIKEETAAIADELKASRIPFVIFLNKIDINPDARHVPQTHGLDDIIVPVSAKTGEKVLHGMRRLLDLIVNLEDTAIQEL